MANMARERRERRLRGSNTRKVFYLGELPEKKIDPTIEEAVKDFPPYNREDGSSWVGSKDYWTSIFEYETNRDPNLHKKFGELHEKIVKMVVEFCEENGLEDVDEFCVGADGLKDAYGYHEWTPGVDSSMSMRKLVKEGEFWVREKKDFLHQI